MTAITTEPPPTVSGKSVTVQVNCDGRRHRIRYDGRHLILLDHGCGDALLTKFGAARCRCLEVLDAWRRFNTPHLPLGLLEPRIAAQQVCLPRYLARGDLPPLATGEVPLAPRDVARLARLQDAVAGCLERCSYKRRVDKRATDDLCVAYSYDRGAGLLCRSTHFYPGNPRVYRTTTRGGWYNNRWTNLHTRVAVAYDWLPKIHTRGLSVIGGCLVVALDPPLFIAGRPTRGYKIETWHATLARPELYNDYDFRAGSPIPEGLADATIRWRAKI